jgi:hypothetical protein
VQDLSYHGCLHLSNQVQAVALYLRVAMKRVVPVSLWMEQLNTKYRQPYHNGSGYHMTAWSLLRSAPASPASAPTWPKGSCWLECQAYRPQRSRSLPIGGATGRLSNRTQGSGVRTGRRQRVRPTSALKRPHGSASASAWVRECLSVGPRVPQRYKGESPLSSP